MRRTALALIATFSALLLAFTVVPAHSQEAGLDRGGRDTKAAESQRALPLHTIRRFGAGEIRNTGRFFVKGKAVTYKGRVLKLQKAATRYGRYHTVKSQRTRASDGFFRMTFDGPAGSHWRVLIPATNWARTTRAYIGRICRNC
jgi:hypothetical protein